MKKSSKGEKKAGGKRNSGLGESLCVCECGKNLLEYGQSNDKSLAYQEQERAARSRIDGKVGGPT